jgi:hypothetical protein
MIRFPCTWIGDEQYRLVMTARISGIRRWMCWLKWRAPEGIERIIAATDCRAMHSR